MEDEALTVFISVLAALYPILHPNTVIEWAPIAPEFLMGIYVALSILPSMALAYHSQSLSFLPAHRLWRAGYGKTVVVWWLGAVILGGVFALMTMEEIEGLFSIIYPIHPVIIVLLSGAILYREGIVATLLFLLFGFIGYNLLFGSILEDPLLVMFSAFFAIPSLLGKVAEKTMKEEGPKGVELALIPLGAIIAMVFTILPGISSPSTAIATLALLTRLNPWAYLAVNGAYLSAQQVYAFKLKERLNVARTGTAEHVTVFDPNLYLLSLMLGGILALYLYRWVRAFYNKPIQMALLLAIFTYVWSSEGIIGVLILTILGGLSILVRWLGMSAFPFFGSLILPILVRNLTRS